MSRNTLQRLLATHDIACTSVTPLNGKGRCDVYMATMATGQIVIKWLPEPRFTPGDYQPAEVLLKAEFETSKLLYEANLGPQPLLVTDNLFVRDFWAGETLREQLRKKVSENRDMVNATLVYLGEIVELMNRHSHFTYIDFSVDNILLTPDGKPFLIDHEWTYRQVADLDDMVPVALGKFVGQLLTLTKLSFDDLRDVILGCEQLAPFEEQLLCWLAHQNVSTASNTLAATLHEVPQVRERLSTFVADSTVASQVRAICTHFDANDIRYCLARAYDDLLNNNTFDHKDLDIFVTRDDFLRCSNALCRNGFFNISDKSFLKVVRNADSVRLLTVDILIAGSPAYRYIDLDDVVKRRVAVNGYYRPCQLHMMVIYLLHSILQKKSFKTTYTEFLCAHIDDATLRNEMLSYLSSLLGDSAKSVMKTLAERDWPALLAMRRELQRVLSQQCAPPPKRWRQLYRLYAAGPPRIIALLGMDGAGKSTTIKKIAQLLDSMHMGYDLKYLGCVNPTSGRHQCFVLPTGQLHRIARAIYRSFRSSSADTAVVAPSEHSNTDETIRVHRYFREYQGMQYIYYWLMFWVLALDCVLMNLRLRCASHRPLIISDRYYYDLITFYDSPGYFRKIIRSLPAPDRAFYLFTEPEAQQQRKRQHTVDEIIQNDRLYRRLQSDTSAANWLNINTELPPDIVALRATLALLRSQRRSRAVNLLYTGLRGLWRRLTS